MSQEQQKTEKADHVIRVFRALIVVLVAIGIGYFVYATTVNPDSKYPFKLGLDLAGGTHLIYKADVTALRPEEVPDLMNVLREVIERRVNVFGVSEPIVQVEGSSIVAENREERLIVELPGVTDVEQAVAEIGKTPLLEFKLVNQAALAAQQALETQFASATADGTAQINLKSVNGVEPYTDTGLTGRYLQRAELVFGQGNTGLSNEPIVSITFNDEGAALFEKITTENVGEMLAIFLDGEVVSSPVINEPISGGQAVIHGDFTPEEGRELVRNLNFGALPVAIELVSTQTIGAALGERAIEAGIFSGTLGLAAIALFMIFWYRLPGLVAAISLTTYVLMMLAIFKLLPVTLTAAGLAGLVLSIGLAVDANILISERLKEELRAGKKPREAIETGFKQAWSSIRDGNLVNILSGIILYWFGDVFIEGFAFTLIIGTIVSLLSSLVISRTFLMALNMEGKAGASRFLMGSGIHK